jgi:hypothetical protein
MTKKRGDLGNAAKDLVEDISDYFSNDNPDNAAGRDINQDYSSSSTDIRNYSNEGDVVEGDQSNTVITASECEPDSISVKTVDAPFWAEDVKTIDIKCKEDPDIQPEADINSQSEQDMESSSQSGTSEYAEVDNMYISNSENSANLISPEPEPEPEAEPEAEAEFEFEFEC